MKVDWRIYTILAGILTVGVLLLLLGDILLIFGAVLVTLTMAFLLGFAKPLKYVGIELVTLSTIYIGVTFGAMVGAVYAVAILLMHLIIGRYYIGPYLVWLLPEYAVLGIASGVLKAGIIGMTGVLIVGSFNTINLLLTFVVEKERGMRYLPYVIGNTAINALLLMQVMPKLV